MYEHTGWRNVRSFAYQAPRRVYLIKWDHSNALGTGLFPEILSTSKSLWYNILSFGVPHAAAHGADQHVNKLRVSERASTSCGWFDYTYPGAVVCRYLPSSGVCWIIKRGIWSYWLIHIIVPLVIQACTRGTPTIILTVKPKLITSDSSTVLKKVGDGLCQDCKSHGHSYPET